jgi:REP element-mobilizing transposase RayT
MTFKPHHDPTHLYFITATILGWKQIFTAPAYAQIVLDSLAWHRQHGRWALYADVLMPNHLHAIVKPLAERTISAVLQSFGSFTAHAILHRLRHDDLLCRTPKQSHWQAAPDLATDPGQKRTLKGVPAREAGIHTQQPCCQALAPDRGSG